MPLVIQQVELVCVGKALLDKVVTNVLLDIIIIQNVPVSVHIQLCPITYKWLLDKPYVNEVTLREKNDP